MMIIYVLISLSVIILSLSIYFFFWAVNNDQYEDFDTPSKHIILDDKKDSNKNDRVN
ncbi:MAG TPA: cbb3-type cytochrome oxidase assembly protein CcoS [Candidatus Azoamicus sp. OHIO2]